MFRAFERRLSIVPRWVIVPTIFKQNVAEHSFYVALYTDKLCQMLPVPDNVRVQAVALALRHDMLEVMHGDIPGPAKGRLGVDDKRDWGRLERATEGDYTFPPLSLNESLFVARVVKMADKIEAAMFLQREVQTGNVGVKPILDAHIVWVQENGPPMGLKGKILSGVIREIQNCADIRLPL